VANIIITTTTQASPDGVHVFLYTVGDVYTIGVQKMPQTLATNALNNGWGATTGNAPTAANVDWQDPSEIVSDNQLDVPINLPLSQQGI